MAPLPLLLVAGSLLLSAVGGSPMPDTPDKIVGGHTTTIKKFPYQVAVIYDGILFCGGSIVSDKLILTAAHCIVDEHNKLIDMRAIRVRAGSTKHASGGQERSLAAMVVDPRYGHDSHSRYRFDAAVLKLRRKLKWTSTVKPIKLVFSGRAPKAGQIITVTGWGRLKHGENEPSSDELRMVQLQVVPHNGKTCSVAYHKSDPNDSVADEMFCAAAKGKDSCQGDSGGPAVDSKHRLMGIVSSGMGCADPRFAGLYTDLANKAVRKFIDKALKTL